MDLALSSEQQQLDDAVRRLLGDHYGFERRQAAAAQPEGWSRDMWRRYAEMGLLALLTPAEFDGLGGGAADLLPLMQACGRSLVLEPFLASAVLAATALAGATDGMLKARLLPRMASGELRLAFAHEEPAQALDAVTLSAARHGTGWRLDGAKCAVLHAAGADSLLVTARATEGKDGVGLFLVEPFAPGLRRIDHLLVDQRSASDIVFREVAATALIEPSHAAAVVIRRSLDMACAALVAEASGAMRGALDATVGYLAVRRQFGHPLSDYQALRHRVADMRVAVETCEAMACMAAVAVDAPQSDGEAARDLARAKLLAGRHGRWVGEQAIQLHGGIGMTEDYVVGHYLQRLLVIDSLLGNEDAQLDRLRALEA